MRSGTWPGVRVKVFADSVVGASTLRCVGCNVGDKYDFFESVTVRMNNLKCGGNGQVLRQSNEDGSCWKRFPSSSLFSK